MRASAMLGLMRARPVVVVLSIAAGWLACEDRSVELASEGAPSTTQTSSDGTATATGGSGTVDSGGTFGSGTPTGTPMGTNGTGGPCTGRGCDGMGGNGHDGTIGAGGSPKSTSSFAGAFGFGDAGAASCLDPDDADYSDCVACQTALGTCMPTPDCQDDPDWETTWRHGCQERGCGPDKQCQTGFACYEPTAACLRPCFNGCTFFCDEGAGVCVRCLSDEHCGPSFTPYCLVGVCVECERAEHCVGGRHCIGGQCVQCVTDTECQEASPRFKRCLRSLNPRENRCVECASHADCEEGQACISDSCF